MNSTPNIVMEMNGTHVPGRHRGDESLIENVQWQIKTGDRWVVGGLHGTGRTTLLLMAAGLAPVQGHHALFGQDSAGASDGELLNQRLQTGFVFEHGTHLFTSLTVTQNIALPLRYHFDTSQEETDVRVNALLKYLELEKAALRFPTQLSPGLRQKASLARALILQPKLLFLDNPAADLDANQIRWWMDILTSIHEGKTPVIPHPVTLVMTTSGLEIWRHFGHQFALIQNRQWVILEGRQDPSASGDIWLKKLLAEPPTGNY
jgi:ABC-type transporter Mla maintaining outer membrane lipid asymmetry ATPase subunit MlaF